MENQTTTNKQPSVRSVTDPRGRPLSPIQNKTAPSGTIGRPSFGALSVAHSSVRAPSVGCPSVGSPSVGRGRPSVGRGRPSVGARSVGARSVVVPSLASPRQPVPELSAAAKEAIAPDAKKTINGVIGKDFVYHSDLRLLRNDQDDCQKLLND